MGIKTELVEYLTIQSPTRPRMPKRRHQVADTTLSLLTLPLRLLVALWPPLTLVTSTAVVALYLAATAR